MKIKRRPTFLMLVLKSGIDVEEKIKKGISQF